MMKQMRENTKWIMLITALAFVGLMVFEWGMDASGRSGGGIGEVGSVNGTPILYQDWMATYRNLQDQAQEQQERPITSQQNAELEDRAWDEMVDQVLIQEQLRSRGIEVTDDEIRRAARFNPPPQLRQHPEFQDAEGRFDLERYQQFLSGGADNRLLLQLEQYYRDVLPRNKLMRQVTSGVYLSDAELWRRYRDRNEEVRIRMAGLDPAAWIDDAEVSVSSEEVERYYRDNREDFRLPARATVRIAALDKTPTAADTAAARELAEDLRREIVEQGADFEEVARRESADRATADRGGDLGTVERGELEPAVEEAAFAASVGEVVGPVHTSSGFHLIQVREKGEETITASRILVAIERTDDSEMDLLIRADSLEAMAETMPLEQAAANLGVELRNAQITEDFPVAPGAGEILEGIDWALDDASPGDVSEVFENDRAFYALELVDVRPAGYRDLADAEPTIRERLRLEKKLDVLVERAGEILERARAEGSLSAVGGEPGIELREPAPFSRESEIEGLGRVPQLAGTAFGLTEGSIGPPVRTDDRVYLVEVLERLPADSTAWAAQKEQQRQMVTAQAQQRRLERWLEGLREQADIRDRRAEVLRAAEEQRDQQQPGFPMGF